MGNGLIIAGKLPKQPSVGAERSRKCFDKTPLLIALHGLCKKVPGNGDVAIFVDGKLEIMTIKAGRPHQ